MSVIIVFTFFHYFYKYNSYVVISYFFIRNLNFIFIYLPCTQYSDFYIYLFTVHTILRFLYLIIPIFIFNNPIFISNIPIFIFTHRGRAPREPGHRAARVPPPLRDFVFAEADVVQRQARRCLPAHDAPAGGGIKYFIFLLFF